MPFGGVFHFGLEASGFASFLGQTAGDESDCLAEANEGLQRLLDWPVLKMTPLLLGQAAPLCGAALGLIQTLLGFFPDLAEIDGQLPGASGFSAASSSSLKNSGASLFCPCRSKA